MDLAAALVKLNIRLGDTDNFAFTTEEKTELLTKAWNDSYTLSTRWDSSLAIASNTWQYARPTGITVVKDIYVKPGDDNTSPEKIGLQWDVVGSNIQFSGNSNYLEAGTTLYIRGVYKYTISDTIAETNVQEYVLNLAEMMAMQALATKKVLKFLKNDVSMNEIIIHKRELEVAINRYRRELPKEYEVA